MEKKSHKNKNHEFDEVLLSSTMLYIY